jgi:hypothetical protein
MFGRLSRVKCGAGGGKCPFGYGLMTNGYDAQHRRQKWTYRQACHEGLAPKVAVPETIYPPPECPYRESASGQGLVEATRAGDG